MTIARKCSIGNHEKCLVGHWCECECHKKQEADTQPTQSDSLMRKDNMLLYTDTIQGKQVLRDDMWAVTTDELKALEQDAVLRARIEELEHISMEVVEPCEPDCDDVRHALHEGSLKAHLKIEDRIIALTNQLNQMKGEK